VPSRLPQPFVSREGPLRSPSLCRHSFRDGGPSYPPHPLFPNFYSLWLSPPASPSHMASISESTDSLRRFRSILRDLGTQLISNLDTCPYRPPQLVRQLLSNTMSFFGRHKYRPPRFLNCPAFNYLSIGLLTGARARNVCPVSVEMLQQYRWFSRCLSDP